MTTVITPPWHAMRTDETRHIEELLRKQGFAKVDAYRYNPAAIRVRVIDPRFEGQSIEQRDAMVEPILAQLPERTQADIITLLTFTESEVAQGPKFKGYGLNVEFDDPSPSIL